MFGNPIKGWENQVNTNLGAEGKLKKKKRERDSQAKETKTEFEEEADKFLKLTIPLLAITFCCNRKKVSLRRKWETSFKGKIITRLTKKQLCLRKQSVKSTLNVN